MKELLMFLTILISPFSKAQAPKLGSDGDLIRAGAVRLLVNEGFVTSNWTGALARSKASPMLQRWLTQPFIS